MSMNKKRISQKVHFSVNYPNHHFLPTIPVWMTALAKISPRIIPRASMQYLYRDLREKIIYIPSIYASTLIHRLTERLTHSQDDAELIDLHRVLILAWAHYTVASSPEEEKTRGQTNAEFIDDCLAEGRKHIQTLLNMEAVKSRPLLLEEVQTFDQLFQTTGGQILNHPNGKTTFKGSVSAHFSFCYPFFYYPVKK